MTLIKLEEDLRNEKSKTSEVIKLNAHLIKTNSQISGDLEALTKNINMFPSIEEIVGDKSKVQELSNNNIKLNKKIEELENELKNLQFEFSDIILKLDQEKTSYIN